ncbi:MAG: hypothetical protein HQL06_13970 [Nitrospirae bacterium]|nr:hypothetical protein [Nitrospirota bacterium]
MDTSTLEQIAEFICGDDKAKYPKYRTGSELTRFFQSVSVDAKHDGSARKWWTQSVLSKLNENKLIDVILRLALPHEYKGEKDQISLAISTLNKILKLESLEVIIEGVSPKLKKITPNFDFNKPETKEERELKSLPQPDFSLLGLTVGIDEILKGRWEEAQRCVDAKAFLSAIIIMGSMLEGLLLGIMQKYQKEANQALSAPKNKEATSVKRFQDWTLSDMINVAHEVGWIDKDVKEFSHALREFRNLIHPYQQMTLQTFPDEDTCNISWPVVQATCNDLASYVKKKNTE